MGEAEYLQVTQAPAGDERVRDLPPRAPGAAHRVSEPRLFRAHAAGFDLRDSSPDFPLWPVISPRYSPVIARNPGERDTRRRASHVVAKIPSQRGNGCIRKITLAAGRQAAWMRVILAIITHPMEETRLAGAREALTPT